MALPALYNCSNVLNTSINLLGDICTHIYVKTCLTVFSLLRYMISVRCSFDLIYSAYSNVNIITKAYLILTLKLFQITHIYFKLIA